MRRSCERVKWYQGLPSPEPRPEADRNGYPFGLVSRHIFC
jgi:hypothetical protein